MDDFNFADEFGEHLRGEWFVGRATAIYDEIWATVRGLSEKRTPRRVAQLLDASESVTSGGIDSSDFILMRMATAQTQAMMENFLLGVASYLAKHEQPAPGNT